MEQLLLKEKIKIILYKVRDDLYCHIINKEPEPIYPLFCFWDCFKIDGGLKETLKNINVGKRLREIEKDIENEY